MEHITVGELKELLKVADDCARVVISQAGKTFPLFDIECVSPVSELVISIKKSEADEQMEYEIAIQNQKLADISKKASELTDLAAEIERLCE